MEMRWPESPQQRDVLVAKRCSVAGHAETDRRDGSAARRVDPDPHWPAGRRSRDLATSCLNGHALPDAVPLVDLDRVWQPQRRGVGLVGGIGPVALVLHLPEIAFETDLDLAARRRVRDRL